MAPFTKYFTHYDTLDVMPSADKLACGYAFREAMLELLDPDFESRSSMWQSQKLNEMSELIEAIRILGHGDRKAKYDQELRKNGVLCGLCDGSGKVMARHGLGGIPCVACGATGKSPNYLAVQA